MNILVQEAGPRPIEVYAPLRTRIRAEFVEMPGLVLSVRQATRLFGVEESRCGEVLVELVDDGFLTADGRRFRRAG